VDRDIAGPLEQAAWQAKAWLYTMPHEFASLRNQSMTVNLLVNSLDNQARVFRFAKTNINKTLAPVEWNYRSCFAHIPKTPKPLLFNLLKKILL